MPLVIYTVFWQTAPAWWWFDQAMAHGLHHC